MIVELAGRTHRLMTESDRQLAGFGDEFYSLAHRATGLAAVRGQADADHAVTASGIS